MYRALLCALLFCCGIASSKAQVAPEDQPATVDKSSSARVGERQECKARIAANNMRRLALIIGNDRTKHFRIQNGVNDARLVAATLNGIGFDVVALYDLSHAQMLSALALFSDKIKELCQNDIVVFYYAGNGEEINRMGFIATTDSEIPSDPSTEREKLSKWVNLKQILDSIQIHQGPKIVILDTCRTDPLAAHRKFQPPVYVGDFRIPKNTLIAYATEPGLEAQDGLPGEKNGPYAAALVKLLRETNLPVELLFRRVRGAVEAATSFKQFPFIESGLQKEVFLKPLSEIPHEEGAKGDRVALVIGNSEYKTVGRLNNPKNDAREMAATLGRLGFKVQAHFDLGCDDLRKALRDFQDRSASADWALIYFAGHGIEFDHKPYIIPIDARLEKDSHIDLEAMLVFRLLESVKGAHKLGLVIMDACRDNPFVGRMSKVLSEKRNVIARSGLPPVEPDDNVLVAYSAKHGFTALDGQGDHSPYVESMLRNIAQPGLEIGMLFRVIRDEVKRVTNGEQQPFTYSSLPGSALYFVPPK